MDECSLVNYNPQEMFKLTILTKIYPIFRNVVVLKIYFVFNAYWISIIA